MKVIKNVNALRSNFIPDNLLFRETLIEDIILKINLGTGNILLSGDTGRGKTASVEIAIKRINSSNEIIIPIIAITIIIIAAGDGYLIYQATIG